MRMKGKTHKMKSGWMMKDSEMYEDGKRKKAKKKKK